MMLSATELDRVEALIAAGESPAPPPPNPPIERPTSFASLVALRRRRLPPRDA
jgi:hypothetical protein